MVTAELKGLLIPDFPTSDHSFEPDSHDDFGIDVVAYVGPAGTQESHEFKLVWCTPQWLSHSLDASHPKLLRAYALTPSWTSDGLEQLEEVVRRLCAATAGPDWGVVASRLSRWLDWEMTFRYDAAVDGGQKYD